MKTIAIAAAALFLATAAQAQPTACKGLAQDACTSSPVGCRWMPARVKGETSPKTGKAYENSAKAHCRKAPAKRSSAAKQDA